MDVYRRLARRFDQIPNGFPATASGVELRLLAKLFTPEEAALAVHMRLTPESVKTIADRAGIEPAVARSMLKAMTRRGLISAQRVEGELRFGLLPFVVGFYEAQLPRMDAELATLIEAYFQETGGGPTIQQTPAVHRVIPVEQSIPFTIEILPHERASTLVELARSWAVRPCICRVQRQLIGKGCQHPIETCLTLAPIEGAFDHDSVAHPLTRDEALRLLAEAEAAGLVHTVGNYREGHFYICNCCTCSCGVLRGVAEFGVPTAIAHSDFWAELDTTRCIGCGTCAERCSFGALHVLVDRYAVDRERCVGCGLCVSTCPSGALSLARRPSGETPPTPADLNAWMLERARQRNLDLREIM